MQLTSLFKFVNNLRVKYRTCLVEFDVENVSCVYNSSAILYTCVIPFTSSMYMMLHVINICFCLAGGCYVVDYVWTWLWGSEWLICYVGLSKLTSSRSWLGGTTMGFTCQKDGMLSRIFITSNLVFGSQWYLLAMGSSISGSRIGLASRCVIPISLLS